MREEEDGGRALALGERLGGMICMGGVVVFVEGGGVGGKREGRSGVLRLRIIDGLLDEKAWASINIFRKTALSPFQPSFPSHRASLGPMQSSIRCGSGVVSGYSQRTWHECGSVLNLHLGDAVCTTVSGAWCCDECVGVLDAVVS